MDEASGTQEATAPGDERSRLRDELRGWLKCNAPGGWPETKAEPGSLADRFAFRHAWHRRLNRGGWLGLQWPKRYGGRELSLSHQIIFNEECARLELPVVAGWVGLELVGPTLLKWGSEHQKQHFLPRILQGEDVWCQGWSEAGAGSDLTSVSSTATRVNDCFVINGQKRWCSWASFASHCLVLARTGAGELRHKSLGCFIVPLSSPGVVVRPIRMANEEAEENDVLMRSVRVPLENLVGAFDGGWPVVLTAMEHARAAAVSMRILEITSSIARLMRLARKRASGSPGGELDPRVRERLMRVVVQADALRHHASRRANEGNGAGMSAASAAEKLLWGRVANEIAKLALHINGAAGLTGRPTLEELWPGEWNQRYFRAKGTAIEGGTTEIHLDTIARRILSAMTC